MKKKWYESYLFFGTLSVVILSIVCFLFFIKPNFDLEINKNSFESIYVDTSIDFIVPSPSKEQVGDIENNDEFGIKTITPFYETSNSVRINDNVIKGTSIIITDASKINNTPYCESRITKGLLNNNGGIAIADELFIKNNQCKINDVVSIRINEIEYNFPIVCISRNNTYYNNGSIALLLTKDQALTLDKEELTYSGAYIEASDYEKCKNYLYSKYKPYGRLKKQAMFSSEDTYNQHLTNFNNADWSKEITDCRSNYSTLKVKYSNVNSSVLRNTIISIILVLVSITLLHLALLYNESNYQFFKAYLIKKSGTTQDIKKFYKNGIVYFCALFSILVTAMSLLYTLKIGNSKLGLITYFIILVINILISLIMITYTYKIIENKYNVKKNIVFDNVISGDRDN